jgi:hypothetical protein
MSATFGHLNGSESQWQRIVGGTLSGSPAEAIAPRGMA